MRILRQQEENNQSHTKDGNKRLSHKASLTASHCAENSINIKSVNHRTTVALLENDINKTYFLIKKLMFKLNGFHCFKERN